MQAFLAFLPAVIPTAAGRCLLRADCARGLRSGGSVAILATQRDSNEQSTRPTHLDYCCGDAVPRFSLVSFACCHHAPLFFRFLREPLVRRTELFITRIELRGLAEFGGRGV